MQIEPFITVLVTAYNVSEYINRCIDSILSQTYKNFELLIINDGSTDNTLEMLQQYKSNPHVQLINKANGGVSSARNMGIKVAKGSYIAQVDGDDYVSKDWLESCTKFLTSKKTDVLYFGLDSVDPDGRELKYGDRQVFHDRTIGKYELLALLSKNIIHSYAVDMFVRKDIFSRVGYPIYPEDTTYEDLATTYRIILQADNICSVSGVYYHYVRHRGSITNQKQFNYKQFSDLESIRVDMVKNLKGVKLFEYAKNFNFQIRMAKLQLLCRNSKKYKVEIKIEQKNIMSELPSELTLKEKIKILLLRVNLYSKIYPLIQKIKLR
ncbi:glycosyltransferase family 2 protein [Lactobacillus crispatus]|uniref:glycosyltransferase family 2 protein n=1 Tax=Lactobacillus crispatus TaxID=47770 RepID=UPI0022E72E80|nr:glycosyltransferase family 2 protein [Lactobacillus crispatus]